MPYTAGYIGRGYRFYPGSLDEPAAKRRRLDLIEDGLVASGEPEAAGFLEALNDSLGDQVGASSVYGYRARRTSQREPRPVYLLNSRANTRSTTHNMPRRRFRRRWRRRRRRGLRSLVKSTMLSMLETKRQLDSVAQATFTSGDGTTRVLYIASPLGQIAQGTSGDDITGDKFWIKALSLRGRLAIDQQTNSLRVRILLIGTRQFADLPVGFTTYGNTTTASTNPAQGTAVGETNIRIFETSAAEEAGQPSAPFVGNASGIDLIDTDYVYVLGGREFFLGTDNANYFKNFEIYVPINRTWRIQSDFDVAAGDQLRSYRDLNYYWIMQVFTNSNANNILAAQDILGTFDIISYFKDL